MVFQAQHYKCNQYYKYIEVNKTLQNQTYNDTMKISI